MFVNIIYEQKDGVKMGASLSPVLVVVDKIVEDNKSFKKDLHINIKIKHHCSTIRLQILLPRMLAFLHR